MNDSSTQDFGSVIRRAGALLVALGLLALPGACKDNSPCDPGQEVKGTGCFPIANAGSGGSSVLPQAGASDGGSEQMAGGGAEQPAAGASGVEPPGNPDAMFGTPCATNEDCGGPAPICATDPLFYCSQINCQDGEQNAGACPADWVCFKYLENPSACVNPSSF